MQESKQEVTKGVCILKYSGKSKKSTSMSSPLIAKHAV